MMDLDTVLRIESPLGIVLEDDYAVIVAAKTPSVLLGKLQQENPFIQCKSAEIGGYQVLVVKRYFSEEEMDNEVATLTEQGIIPDGELADMRVRNERSEAFFDKLCEAAPTGRLVSNGQLSNLFEALEDGVWDEECDRIADDVAHAIAQFEYRRLAQSNSQPSLAI